MQNNDNLLRWVEDLESGEFEQTTDGYLKNLQGQYCCLGVLEERRVEFRPLAEVDHAFRVADELGSRALPRAEAITEYLGLPNGMLGDGDLGSVAVNYEGDQVTVHALNDQGVSFREIARLIRETYNLPPQV